MAHYLLESGQPGPFGYMGHDMNFGGMGDATSRQSLLDPREADQLNGFFDNPDVASMHMPGFALNWDTKVDDTLAEQEPSGLDRNTRTVSNPAATLAGVHSNIYQSHTNQQSHMSTPTEGDFMDVNAASEEHSAASGLYQLSTHGRHRDSQAHAQAAIDLPPAAQWGRINLTNSSTNNPFMPAPIPQGGMNHWQQPAHQSQNGQPNYRPAMTQGHSHPQSRWSFDGQPVNMHMINTNAAHAPHQPPHQRNPQLFYGQQMQAAQFAGQQVFSNLQFGSDPSFGHQQFPAPPGWDVLQQVKGSNLNDVPLREQAAHSAHNHMQSSAAGNRGYPNGTPTGFHQNMTSRAGLAGLPTSYGHGHPRQMALPTTEDDAGRGTPQSKEKTRKRTRTEDDEDDDFSPPSQLQRSGGKRVVKQEGADSPNVITPASAKRRKSSNILTVQSPESDSEDDSSRSDSGEPSANKRSRNRKSQSRQNLSLEDKRRNHIQSEKMRRDLIKVQYEALDDMVPGLKGGKSGLSRADVLEEICEFIRAVEEGNREVERMLARNKAGGGAGGSGGAGG